MSGLLDDLRAQLDGTYRIDRELGGGGMSRVFLAEEIALGRRVVLKLLAPDLAHVLSAERFEREMRVAARFWEKPAIQTGRFGSDRSGFIFTRPKPAWRARGAEPAVAVSMATLTV